MTSVFSVLLVTTASFAGDRHAGIQHLKDAAEHYRLGNYFNAARYGFAAIEDDSSLRPEGYAWITIGLIRAGLPHSASYFFIRTLQTGDQASIRSVLTQAESLLLSVGADLFRKYLIRHTHYEDYDAFNLSAYLYSLGKDALLSGDTTRALGYLNGVDRHSSFWPYGLQLRGTAYAILGKGREAIQDFRNCVSTAGQIVGRNSNSPLRMRQSQREVDDLGARCIAGEARTHYQLNEFLEADRVYDSIQKKSFLWPDILFEQAWNAFARTEFNRTLGKLVSYKSPALEFVFNPEIDVLRSQAFLALCLYSDANEVVNEFNARYTAVGIEVKEFVERNVNDLGAFYTLGKGALKSSLYIKNDFYRLANRFVRGPYFQDLVAYENQINREMQSIRIFDSKQTGVGHNLAAGFPGFLNEVLRWRMRTIQLLGGAFVKNSLIDYHVALIEDFEKMAFIKLEMLKLAKDSLINQQASSQKPPQGSEGGRRRGNQEPTRRDDQLKWSFNGEFWGDELGDYVFGLESECKG